jgi:hypothetical protein
MDTVWETSRDWLNSRMSASGLIEGNCVRSLNLLQNLSGPIYISFNVGTSSMTRVNKIERISVISFIKETINSKLICHYFSTGGLISSSSGHVDRSTSFENVPMPSKGNYVFHLNFQYPLVYIYLKVLFYLYVFAYSRIYFSCPIHCDKWIKSNGRFH